MLLSSNARYPIAVVMRYPEGMRVTGYGRLPISGQSLHKLSSVYSVPLAKRVVNKESFKGFDEYGVTKGVHNE